MIAVKDLVPVSQCPLCRSPDREHASFAVSEDREIRLQYHRCTRCGIVFQSPRPSDETLSDFYEADYRKRLDGSELPTRKDHWVEDRRAEHALGFIEPQISQVAQHLDVGSSLGALLKVVQARYHCASYGVEPGRTFRGQGLQEGIQVVADLADLPNSLYGSVDLITMMHVLEHLSDPVETLSDLAEEWLKPTGYLIVEVPNLYAHPSFEFPHLTAFSPSRLVEAARQAGYKLLRLKVHGRPYSRLLPLFILAIFQRADPSDLQPAGVRPERWVGLKRFLGYGRTQVARWVSPLLVKRALLQPWDAPE